jgi:hypothetical protein
MCIHWLFLSTDWEFGFSCHVPLQGWRADVFGLRIYTQGRFSARVTDCTLCCWISLEVRIWPEFCQLGMIIYSINTNSNTLLSHVLVRLPNLIPLFFCCNINSYYVWSELAANHLGERKLCRRILAILASRPHWCQCLVLAITGSDTWWIIYMLSLHTEWW